jgi:quercetin 2,3-dioxygenase
MPKGDPSGALYGFQLWANLPATDKMMDPRYRGISAAQIPEVKDGSGAKIKVIAGTVNGTTGPVTDVVTQPEYLDVTVPPGATFSRETPRGHTVFAYVIGGEGMFGRQRDPYSYEAEGSGYFDMSATRSSTTGTSCSSGTGTRWPSRPRRSRCESCSSRGGRSASPSRGTGRS